MLIRQALLLVLLCAACPQDADALVGSPLFAHTAGAEPPTDDSTRNDSRTLDGRYLSSSFDQIVHNRYACTRFQRHDGVKDSVDTPSESCDNALVQAALGCLDLARRAPSGFNVQPYKMVMIKSPKTKSAVAKYCIGRNAHRVRDSDCTAVFLADRRTLRSLGNFRRMTWGGKGKEVMDKSSRRKQWINRLKTQFYIGLFSSGLPIPKILSGPISFAARYVVRLFVAPLSWLLLRFPLPTLTSADTWSHKNTMLAAMVYMLGCTSRGISTCPMEGYAAPGILKALKVPPGYTIPLIVSTGRPYHKSDSSMGEFDDMFAAVAGKKGRDSPGMANKDTTISGPGAGKVRDEPDDTGMRHGGPGSGSSSPRYSAGDMIFIDAFGNSWKD